MADQLSLSLDPSPIGWPATGQAMGAQPADEPFDDPDTLFEPWWGGERALAFLSDRRLAVEEEPAASKDREDSVQVHLLPLDEPGEARRLT
ncbi:MAG: hypothetical protein ACHQXL_04930, partial [Candidatus Limnocylindrales bacterium]